MGTKLLLCKHDECEQKTRLYFYTQYKISTALCDFIPNADVGGLSIRLKIKKKKYQNKNNKRKQKTTTKKLNLIAKLGFETQSLVWKAKLMATRVLYHMAS